MAYRLVRYDDGYVNDWSLRSKNRGKWLYLDCFCLYGYSWAAIFAGCGTRTNANCHDKKCKTGE